MNNLNNQEICKSPSEFKNLLKKTLDGLVRTTGKDMHTLRREVVFEAALRRMGRSGIPFVLKGAYALEVRSPLRSRTTKDLDILLLDSGEMLGKEDDIFLQAVRGVVARSLRTEADDFFSFEIVEVKKEIDNSCGRGLRLFIAAKLLGANFERFLMDVVVGDTLVGQPETASAGRYLSTMGFAVEPIPVLPLAQHFAEKVHAYTLPREGKNSRVKDLVDFIVLADIGFPAEELARAVDEVFSHRSTHRPPTSLPLPPRDWTEPYGRLAAGAGIELSMAEAHKKASVVYRDGLKNRRAASKIDTKQ
jgi:hypothetical protein